jgi:hypothetical protein
MTDSMEPVSKPLLLLDVDGVLNCFGSMWTPGYEGRSFLPVMTSQHGYRIRVPKRMPELIGGLLDVFQPVWATAWEEEAHPFFREALNLDDEPWPHISWVAREGLDMPRLSTPERSWKRPWVEAYVKEAGRPWCWIDDEPTDQDVEWAANMRPEGLIVRTRPHAGLTRLLAERAMRWGLEREHRAA